MESWHNSQVTAHELPVDNEPPPPLPPKPKSGVSHRAREGSFSNPAASPAQTPCCECEGTDLKTWKCLQCDDSFCDVCWAKQRPHRPGKTGLDDRPHEKVDEEVVQRLKQTFSDPSPKEQSARHINDLNTTWFGVIKEANQGLSLHYSTRLVDIMHDSQSGEYQERFPQLVSFVGQTGAGKSTVIKMLINREHSRALRAQNNSTDLFPVPVPGLSGDTVPTTGDVHLYSDPGTYYAKNPILYADCEGLTGGENTPRGIKNQLITDTAKKGKNKLRKRIAWANNPKMQSREFAVSSLFPRILYTFSDVVVFVLREARTFETEVVKPLLNWAAASMDKAVNQPSLPHVVIVLNATEVNIDDRLWDPKQATSGLLEDYRNSVENVPAFREHVARLEVLKKKPRSTKELLEYYYSSVTVVRIPTKGRYMQIDEQVSKLQQIISHKCAISHEQKRSIRMLLNAERLPQYITAAYDHFSQNLDSPFDFVEEARHHAPLPQDFGGHILNLIKTMYHSGTSTRICPKSERGSTASMYSQGPIYRADTLLEALSRPIASCVILAATRDHTQGTFSDLLRNTYYRPIAAAYDEFCTQWLRCSFQKGEHPCVNVLNSHKKGHQSGTGKVLVRAAFESVFDQEKFFPRWMAQIEHHIDSLSQQLDQNFSMDGHETAHVVKLHRKVISGFYNGTALFSGLDTVASLKSHVTCLCCVRKIPEHFLPCGHALCGDCVQSFGRDMGQGLFDLKRCPLHPSETTWDRPVRIRFKPKDAGVRILCLDGGGVRGIVELALLNAIQKELGPYIPVQDFFDLIVGTSTGGIIALGLGVKRWSVDECIQRFKELCPPAFTRRSYPAFKHFELMTHKSWYRNKTLESELQSAFGNKLLFGGPTSDGPTDIRVAVTSTTASENRPVILTNYNTRGDERDSLQYEFVRPQDPTSEFAIWQAARATAAAPIYFKSFVHSGTAYIDGAVQNNCPAIVADSERRRIWDDVSDWPADILLSLGTGLSAVKPKAQKFSITSWDDDRSPQSLARQKSLSGIRYGLRLAFKIIDDQLNCERIWSEYLKEATVRGDHRCEDRRRNMRINVPFHEERPPLDAVDDVQAIEDHSLLMIQNDLYIRADIHEAAHRLVASCFYFEVSPTTSGTQRSVGYTCKGDIRCRFDEGSQNTKGLGAILRDHICGRDFTPHFYLQENYGSREERPWEIPIEQDCIDAMCQRGVFELPGDQIDVDSTSQASVTRISLCLQSGSYVPFGVNWGYRQNTAFDERGLSISGFPRILYQNHGVVSPSPSISSSSKAPRHESAESPQPPHQAQSEHNASGLRSKLSMRFSRTAKLEQSHKSSRWSDPGSVKRDSQTTLDSVAELPGQDAMSLRSMGSQEDSKVANGIRGDD